MLRLRLGSIAAWRMRSRVRALSFHFDFISWVQSFLHALAFINSSHAHAFIWSGYFVAFALVFPSFSLPVFFFLLVTCCRVQHSPCSVVVLRFAALCLVSRRSVWSRGGALLRRLSQCRCECEFDFPCESLGSCISWCLVPLLFRSKHRGTIVSPSLTLLLVGRTGWLHYLQRRRNHLPAPPARTASLRSSPSLPSPRTPRPGLMSGEILFKIWKCVIYIW